MKLDRNINPDGRGKYALVNLRKLHALQLGGSKNICLEALDELLRLGVLSYGDESPGDQFFVMKYKDKLTPFALRAYAVGAMSQGTIEMDEFGREIMREAKLAEEASEKLPD